VDYAYRQRARRSALAVAVRLRPLGAASPLYFRHLSSPVSGRPPPRSRQAQANGPAIQRRAVRAAVAPSRSRSSIGARIRSSPATRRGGRAPSITVSGRRRSDLWSRHRQHRCRPYRVDEVFKLLDPIGPGCPRPPPAFGLYRVRAGLGGGGGLPGRRESVVWVVRALPRSTPLEPRAVIGSCPASSPVTHSDARSRRWRHRLRLNRSPS
jgi:hypothetical protein